MTMCYFIPFKSILTGRHSWLGDVLNTDVKLVHLRNIIYISDEDDENLTEKTPPLTKRYGKKFSTSPWRMLKDNSQDIDIEILRTHYHDVKDFARCPTPTPKKRNERKKGLMFLMHTSNEDDENLTEKTPPLTKRYGKKFSTSPWRMLKDNKQDIDIEILRTHYHDVKDFA